MEDGELFSASCGHACVGVQMMIVLLAPRAMRAIRICDRGEKCRICASQLTYLVGKPLDHRRPRFAVRKVLDHDPAAAFQRFRGPTNRAVQIVDVMQGPRKDDGVTSSDIEVRPNSQMRVHAAFAGSLDGFCVRIDAYHFDAQSQQLRRHFTVSTTYLDDAGSLVRKRPTNEIDGLAHPRIAVHRAGAPNRQQHPSGPQQA